MTEWNSDRERENEVIPVYRAALALFGAAQAPPPTRRTEKVLQQAVEMMGGDQDAAREWLSTPHHALGGKVPTDCEEEEVQIMAGVTA
jgi:hypothetical protein